MLCLKVGMLPPFLAMHRPLLATLRPFVTTRPPFLAMRHPFLVIHRPFPARLYAFAATPSEGEEARHEESHGHHAVRRVLFLVLTTPRQNLGRAVPSRERGSKCVGSS
jgi:hypothetical protein